MSRRKIRRVDFSPDEFLAGVGKLGFEQIGVYWVVCSLIYSRGEPVDNDARWISRAAECRRPSDCRRWLDELIALGKLTVNPDGKLENGRAMVELGKALGRVDFARQGGKTSAAKRQRNGSETALKRLGSGVELDPVSAEINDLPSTQPSTINHQLTKKESETRSNERVTRARKAPKTGQLEFPTTNGAEHGDEQRHRLARDWRPSESERQFAQSLGLDTDAIAESFVLWWVEGKGQREKRTDAGWGLTWRGWCRRDAGGGGRGAAARNGSGLRPADGGGLAGAAARLRARHRQQ